MKQIKQIVLCAVASIFLLACGRDGVEENIDFETIVAERSVSITREEGAPTCNVRLELACAKESKGERAKTINNTIALQLLDIESVTLKQAADSFANTYTRSYVTNYAPLYREDASDPVKRAWYEYHYNISSEAANGREGVTVYIAAIDYYEGGAHGVNQQLVMNFDNKTGKQMHLSDFFVPGYQQPLNEKLLKALLELTGEEDENDLHDKGYLYQMDMFATENFMAGDGSFTFIYNPYELAPYSAGIIKLELKEDELDDILKK